MIALVIPLPVRANGRFSRRALVERGLALTAQGGRHRASIGALAAALGMSKSAVHAHFGSKGALDAALVEEAADRFDRAVLTPAGAAPSGLARLAALCEGFVVYATDEPGPRLTPAHRAFGRGLGAAAEARLTAWTATWRQALEASAADAVVQGEFAATADPAQVAFELGALVDGAVRALDHATPAEVRRRARRALDRALVGWSTA
jgi:AcrR family transcriptional regulator